jgi:hypothetical protein
MKNASSWNNPDFILTFFRGSVSRKVQFVWHSTVILAVSLICLQKPLTRARVVWVERSIELRELIRRSVQGTEKNPRCGVAYVLPPLTCQEGRCVLIWSWKPLVRTFRQIWCSAILIRYKVWTDVLTSVAHRSAGVVHNWCGGIAVVAAGQFWYTGVLKSP